MASRSQGTATRSGSLGPRATPSCCTTDMANRRFDPNLARAAIVGPPFAWLLLFFLTPFVIVAAISLGQNAPDSAPPVAMTGTLRNYAFLLSDSLYLDAYLSSLRI